MGEEPGEDGQCPNTREKLIKTVYKKINENCGVGYFAVGEFWYLKNVPGTAIKKSTIFIFQWGLGPIMASLRLLLKLKLLQNTYYKD